MRPTAHCYCDDVPLIKNRTQLIVLQHRREWAHPFNTARMVERALVNSRLLTGHVESFTPQRLQIPNNAGLLYPGPNSQSLDELSAEEMPACLVAIDGTWDHANRMYKDIEALQSLPQFKLKPSEPGNYRIRVEPTATALSTVEAVVAALQIIEPDTAKLDELLSAFETMVDRQLAHPLAGDKYNRQDEPTEPTLNIPKSLLGDLNDIVVAYGEAGPKPLPGQARLPIYWVAQRLGAEQTFNATLVGGRAVKPVALQKMGLSQDDFADAISTSEFAKRWNEYCRPNDLLVVQQTNSIALLKATGVRVADFETLKSINVDPRREFATRAEFFAANGIILESQIFAGRAGERLASQVTLVRNFAQLKASN